jgi:hypothetical protein
MKIARHVQQFALAVIAVLLGISLWWMLGKMDKVAQLKRQSARISADANFAKQQSMQLAKFEEHVQLRKELRQKVKASDLSEPKWSSRVLQSPGTLIPRDQAEHVLKVLASNRGDQWFAAESFDISVGVPSEGLFTAPSKEDRGFNLQMTGVVYFKAE